MEGGGEVGLSKSIVSDRLCQMMLLFHYYPSSLMPDFVQAQPFGARLLLGDCCCLHCSQQTRPEFLTLGMLVIFLLCLSTRDN